MTDIFGAVKVGDVVNVVSPFGVQSARVSKVMMGRLCIEGSRAQFRKSDGLPIRANYHKRICPPKLTIVEVKE